MIQNGSKFLKKTLIKISFIDEKKFNLIFKNKDNIYGIIGLPRNKFDSNKLKLFKNLEWLHFNGAGIESYMDPWLLNSKYNNKWENCSRTKRI